MHLLHPTNRACDWAINLNYVWWNLMHGLKQKLGNQTWPLLVSGIFAKCTKWVLLLINAHLRLPLTTQRLFTHHCMHFYWVCCLWESSLIFSPINTYMYMNNDPSWKATAAKFPHARPQPKNAMGVLFYNSSPFITKGWRLNADDDDTRWLKQQAAIVTQRLSVTHIWLVAPVSVFLVSCEVELAASRLCPSRSRTCPGQRQIRSPGKGSCCRQPGEGGRFPEHSAPVWDESLRRICCHASLLHHHYEPEAVNRTGFPFLCDSWTHPPALSVIHNSPPATGNYSINIPAKNIQ